MICSIWSLFFLSAVTNRKNLQVEKPLPLSPSFYLPLPKGLTMSQSGFCWLVLKIVLPRMGRIPPVLCWWADRKWSLLQKEWWRFEGQALQRCHTNRCIGRTTPFWRSYADGQAVRTLISEGTPGDYCEKAQIACTGVTKKLQAGEPFAQVFPL